MDVCSEDEEMTREKLLLERINPKGGVDVKFSDGYDGYTGSIYLTRDQFDRIKNIILEEELRKEEVERRNLIRRNLMRIGMVKT